MQELQTSPFAPLLPGSSLRSGMAPPRVRLLFAALWSFLMFNYLYADVISLMDSRLLPQYLAGEVSGLSIPPGFLLSAAVLMEVPIAMVLLVFVLPYDWMLRANITAGTLKTLAMLATLFVGTPTLYYAFFAAIEIPTSAFIVLLAWRWRTPSTTSWGGPPKRQPTSDARTPRAVTPGAVQQRPDVTEASIGGDALHPPSVDHRVCAQLPRRALVPREHRVRRR